MTEKREGVTQPHELVTLAVGIRTYKAVTYLRHDLLRQTAQSAAIAFPGCPIGVFDVGSDDGSADLDVTITVGEVTAVGSPWSLVPEDGNHTPGNATLLIAERLRELSPQIMVISDDDMAWKPGAVEKLRKFWLHAPDDVVIVSGLLEDLFALPEPDDQQRKYWNEPFEVIEAGGVKALSRASVPGCAWSFRIRHLRLLRSLIEPKWGYDYDCCKKLVEGGYRVAAMDLATHEGWEFSTHGNEAIEKAKPLDRERWGI